VHRTSSRPRATLVVATGLVVVLSACRAKSNSTPPAETAVSTSAPPATEAPSATSTLPATTAPTTVARATTTAARRPEAVVPNQGDRVFAVFVATADSPTDPSFATATARLRTLGYRVYASGDTGCSQGAQEALPQLQGSSLSVEFRTRADADRFAALYGPVIGIAAVTVFCAD